MAKNEAIDIVKKLKPEDRYVVTVSVLRDGNINNTVTVNNFLTLDIPIIRNKISEELYNSYLAAQTVEDSSVPVTELKLKSALE